MTPPRIVPHRTRVDVVGEGAGMVVAVHNARRRYPGFGQRVEVQARVSVVLDRGGNVTVPVSLVSLEARS